MDESYLIYLILFFLISIQSIVGVGILVIGTPFLLIYEMNILDIYLLLLPISIITSAINAFILVKRNTYLDINIKQQSKKFFFVCLPSVFVGLLLLREYELLINFKYLVSSVILFTIFFMTFFKNGLFKLQNYHLGLVGIVHGITNSGGTLLSLFFSQGNEKNNIRLSISFFYFLLALSQYLIIFLLFDIKISYLLEYNLILILFLFLIGIFLGNFTVKYLNLDMLKLTINALALLTCVVLIFS